MSTADDGHPDARWIARVTADLQAWLDDAPAGPAPTHSLTGGGAVQAFEAEMSARHGGRPAVMTPSATYGLRLALGTLGVGPGTEVLVPGLDWPSTYAAVLSLGAVPVPVAVDRSTLTISPRAAANAVTDRTVASVACHLHGVCADVPALRTATGGLPVVEDCAAALGSTLDHRPAGTLGEFAVFSVGPGKQVDAGEGGVVLARDEQHRVALERASAHPLRLARVGLDDAPDPAAFSLRPHPLAAVLATVGLRRYDTARHTARHAVAAGVARSAGTEVLGADARRTSAQPAVPVVTTAPVRGSSASGALVLGDDPAERTRCAELLARVRLLPVAPVTPTPA